MHASFPILSALVLLPILGAILVTVISNKHLEYVKLIAMLFSVGVGGMSIWLLASFHSHDSGFQFVSQHDWVSSWGISWHLGVDGVSLFLVVLTGILFPLVILGVDPHHDHKRYLAWLLLLEAGVMGSFLSLDLFLFFIFFEIVLVPMYFLIGGWGYDSVSTQQPSSFCTRCSVRHLCWSALLLPQFSRAEILGTSLLTW